MPNRRNFLRAGSKLVVGGAVAGSLPSAYYKNDNTARVAAADKINIALIGCKSMGFGDLANALKQPGVQCTALCDIDAGVLNTRGQEVEKLQGYKPALYKDFRKLLEQKDIDAVIIGTPDHWHCLPFVYACQAGKDVYVEKPLANSIGECEVMVKAARKYNRVVQVGQQQRSGAHWKQAMDFIKEGKLGQLRKCQIWANFNYGVGQPKKANGTVPAGVDYDLWLGPAPQRAFNENRFHGSWRMFWDYGGGLTTDWGVHLIDMALWAKDITAPPQAVSSTGGNFSFTEFDHETFDTQSVIYQLPGYTISWEHSAGTQQGPFNRLYGLAFTGNYGTLVIDRDGWELFPENENGQYKIPAMPKQRGSESHILHMQNFIECIRSRKEPACPIENGRLVALYSHMGNIALRTNSRLEWDEKQKNFGTNKAANALITPTYRKPWTFPVV